MSGARTPQVVSGPRGPRLERIAEAESAARAGQAVDIPPGKVQFQATAARYRLQLVSDEKKRGKDTIEKTRFVQFENFVSPLYDEVKDARLLAEVREHPAYSGEDDRYPKEIFDLAEVLKMTKLAETKKTSDRIKADPEFRAAVLAALKESEDDDFEAPKRE